MEQWAACSCGCPERPVDPVGRGGKAELLTPLIRVEASVPHLEPLSVVENRCRAQAEAVPRTRVDFEDWLRLRRPGRRHPRDGPVGSDLVAAQPAAFVDDRGAGGVPSIRVIGPEPAIENLGQSNRSLLNHIDQGKAAPLILVIDMPAVNRSRGKAQEMVEQCRIPAAADGGRPLI